MRKPVALPDFIRALGIGSAAELLGESRHTVKGWRYTSRTPRLETALKIVEKTKDHPAGPVTMERIYPDIYGARR